MAAHPAHRTRVDSKNNLRMMWKLKYYEIPQCGGLGPQEVALAAESGSLSPSKSRSLHTWLQRGSLVAGARGFRRQSIPRSAGLDTSVAPTAPTKKLFLLTESLSDGVEKGQAKSSHWGGGGMFVSKIKEVSCALPKSHPGPDPALPAPGAPAGRRTWTGVTLHPAVLLQPGRPCSKPRPCSARPFSRDEPCLPLCCWDPRGGVGVR